jgi:hypothetical protein
VEIACITDLQPRRQFLLKRPDASKVPALDVDPRAYWIYTNTPLDNDACSVPHVKETLSIRPPAVPTPIAGAVRLRTSG